MKSAALGMALIAFAPAMSATAGAQEPTVAGSEGAPFVDISLLGSDVMYRPQRISYKVTADPGSYVTVILISPRGARTLLDPAGIAVEGPKRGALYREARTGNEPGESYVVAIATRNRFHSSSLVRQARNSSHFASRYYSAEASLDDLLTGILPAAGNDFTTAFISFRLLSAGFPRTLAYAGNCYPPLLVQTRLLLADEFPDEWVFDSPFYDAPAALNPFGYSSYGSYATAACEDMRLNRRLILANAPIVPIPTRPRDTTTTTIDSVPNPVRGDGPIVHHPVAPRPLDVQPFVNGPVRPTPLDARPNDPVVRPVPVERSAREPLAPVTAPRTDPVVRVERERPVPVSQPPVPATRPSVPLSQPPVPREHPDPTTPPPPRVTPVEPRPDAKTTAPANQQTAH